MIPARSARARTLLAAALVAGAMTAYPQATESPNALEDRIFALAAVLGSLADFGPAFSPGGDAIAALVRLAEEGNPGLAAARGGIAGADADLAAARSKRMPRIDGTVSATGIANPMDAVSIPAGALATVPMELPPEPVDLMDAQDPFWWRAQILLEQPLFAWGKIRAGIDMAQAGNDAARLAFEKSRHEILLKAGASAESLAILARLDEVLRLQVTVGERLVFISEQNRKAGFITQAELLAARIDVKELDLARAELVKRRELLLQDLRGLTGRPDLSLEDLALEAPKAGMPRLEGAELAAAARSGSVDLSLVAALERMSEAGKRLAAGSGVLHPDLALQVELACAGSRIPLLQDAWDGKDDWTLNVTIAASLSLFDGGEARAARDKAEADLVQARARSAEAQAGIDALLRSAFLDLDLSRVRLEYDLLKLDGHRETLATLRAESDAGSGSEADYLRALLDTLGTIADGWSRLAEYRAALWKLEAALAGE
ncbi:MAG: TolC family protein [Spirochaetes bacterium]|nr:TolC family protein [Spirochaetota bacterium]